MLEKKSGVFSKWIVALIVILNSIFTGTVLYVFYRVGSEPTVLIGCWFGFTTGELFFLSSIRKRKIDKENKEEI